MVDPAAAAAGSGTAPPAPRPATAPRRGSSRSGLGLAAARTIIETAACPPTLKRGEGRAWAFADFRVQRMLGEGAMSSVLACVDGRSGTPVVIKMYHKERMNGMNVKQARREAGFEA